MIRYMYETHGIMMSLDDVIELLIKISQILNDDDVEVDAEFTEKYTCMMNRIRYERDKSYGVPPKKIKKIRGSGYFTKCGNCGSESIDREPQYNYCPNCGYEIRKN